MNYSFFQYNCDYMLQRGGVLFDFEGLPTMSNNDVNIIVQRGANKDFSKLTLLEFKNSIYMRIIDHKGFYQSDYFLFDAALLFYSNTLVICEYLKNISCKGDINIVLRLPGKFLIDSSQDIINDFLTSADIVVGSMYDFNVLLDSGTDSETISKLSDSRCKINYAVIINSTGVIILNNGLLHVIPIVYKYKDGSLLQEKIFIDTFTMLFLYGLIKGLLWRNAAQVAGFFAPMLLSNSCAQFDIIEKINEFLKKQSK